MGYNRSGWLGICAALILVSLFLYLPTMLVLGQNKAIHTVSVDEVVENSDGTSFLRSSRVEYFSSGWTNFTVDTLSATNQADGEEAYFGPIFLAVYSGSSDHVDDLIYYSFLLSLFSNRNFIALRSEESTVSLVFFILNNNQVLENIEVEYSIEAEGVSVGTPRTVGLFGSLPFSTIALILAFAALGTMIVLISFRRVKLKG